MFDFSEEKKEKYYLRAEMYLQENRLSCLKVDRDKFTVQGKEHLAKVYFVSFSKKTVTKKELEKAKTLDKIVITNDRTTKPKPGKPESIRENGYVELELDEEDW